jgi:hypothetical protein
LSNLDDRHRALLRVLVRHEVRFVVVGGVALQLRGFSGATRDVDVTIAADALNRRQLASALEALRARPYLAGKAELIVVGEKTLEKGFDGAVTRASSVVKRDFSTAIDKLSEELKAGFKS